ncbi:beta-xylosidase [Gracilibacillus boraciitolerans JCM 21714]|uniref:Beta-xylosidase n=1 Tax=Gracilibacillus boraciitolerans JCM 21714 TaxID=1298598 RepID=W4VGU5_9BACI|nr:xylan 1,4-beta-xylosidase [Gracilibacillus boraciitolerans]GAE91969.1 beta-xylosidase [Gracilibacillus boraciitolerans JCM 21714]
MTLIQINRDNDQYFPDHWKKCIGTGRLGLALQKEYLDHLKAVQEDIGFSYIRGHGLLHDDIAIYREVEIDGEMKPFYNFTYIDRIFDSFLEVGLKPFVEIGFMPKQLASGDQTIFAWEGNVTPPKDYQLWEDLIKAVTQHFIERYGIEEVLTWPFEIWNEPNLVNFWKDADKQEYFKLYKVTANAVKAVHADIQVGGPAICGGSDEWITDFLTFCEKEKVPVDFVSRHAYTSRPPHQKNFEYYYQELAKPEKMLNEFATVRQLIDEAGYANLPFHITEYNTSYSPLNPVHDTTLNAAYLAKILSEGGDHVDSYSYWTFSDVFEESDVPRSQFHGGFGLMGLGGIKKPTYHLFAFFNRLGSKMLYRDDQLIVTEKQNGNLAVIVWNLVMDKNKVDERDVTLEFPLDNNKYFVISKSINEEYANPWRVWQQMGRPRFPTKTQLEILKDSAIPQFQTEQHEVISNRLILKLTLKKNEVRLLEIERVKDETGTYPLLDDSLIESLSKD